MADSDFGMGLIIAIFAVLGILFGAVVTAFTYRLRHARIYRDLYRSERELGEREERLRSFIDNAASIVWVKDLDGRFLIVNRYAEKVIGKPREELIGRTVFDIFPPDLAQIYTEADRRVIVSGESVELDETARFEDGEHTFASVKFPLRDADGHICAVGAICTDITARKKGEESLRRQNVYLEALNEIALGLMSRMELTELFQAIVVRAMRFAGTDEGWICIYEPQSGDFEFKAAVGKSTYQIGTRFESGRGIAGEVWRTGQTVLVDDYHVWPRRANVAGYELRRATVAVPLKYEGRLAGVLGLAHYDAMRRFDDDDLAMLERLAKLASISLYNTRLYDQIKIELAERKRADEEKKKLQEQLLQSQKMESVGRLAGGVAHDFNNMLQAILGYSELALSQIDPAQPLYGNLQEIRKAAKRSADLTRQLLAFARKQTIHPRVLDLNDTVAGMLKMLRRLIGEDIDLVWKPGPDLWPVKMDPAQIDQILANLSVNARDAIAGVGNLTIETENVVFDETYCAERLSYVPGEYVLLAVSDTGSGMDEEILEHLFEPFFTTKEIGKGTGLGMATVFGIVKQNNGFINVYSERGEGTTIKIYLPRVQAEAAAAATIAQRPLGGAETVLIVEDEASILSLGKDILEGYGYTVLAARTPAEAEALAERHRGPIHILITDVVMPEMNGRNLAEKISALKRKIKTLYMSGYTANVIVHHGVLEAGVNFLQKPFSVQALATKVREVLDQPALG